MSSYPPRGYRMAWSDARHEEPAYYPRPTAWPYDDFVRIRRKATRWAADNKPALRAARPTTPFDNREEDNWTLLFAIADLAGDDFGKQARAAAIKLSKKRAQQSEPV